MSISVLSATFEAQTGLLLPTILGSAQLEENQNNYSKVNSLESPPGDKNDLHGTATEPIEWL